MRSKLGMNKVRKRKLLRILQVLFPEYKYFHIKNNGSIWFRKRWFSLEKTISLYELLFTEVTKRLSKYRNGSKAYNNLYTERLFNTLSTDNQNIIDSLYQEFLNLKDISITERLLENSNTFTLGKLIKNTFKNTPISVRVGFMDANNLFKKFYNPNVTDDRYSRIRFVSIIQ